MATVVELANELARLKDQKDDLDNQVKTLNLRIEAITKQELPEAMDADGVSNIKLDGVGRISLRGEVYASIKKEDQPAAYEWLRHTGRGSLITETVNASSLKAAAKSWLKAGDVVPDFIRIQPITVAVLTRG